MQNQNTGGGVLLLSHVGFSFMEDLVEALDARQLKSFVLTSLPEEEHRAQRLHDLRGLATQVTVTEDHALTRRDVDQRIEELRSQGENVLFCITVWEGYRHLMACANEQLGAGDLAEKQVLDLRDKLALRNRLADARLTRVRAARLTEETLALHQGSGRRCFVKPVSGIASYGAFPLTSRTTWADIERITADALQDTVYASAFGDGPAFLVEDYIAGREFSFEIVVVDGEANIVAMHEKCEVTETTGTVLENACTSPPESISADDCAQGIAWVRRLLSHLDLRWGCFHIEARHHASQWDLIEVNPRVGGSLISHSVKELTAGTGLLDLWIDSLLTSAAGDAETRQAFLDGLRALSFTDDGRTPTANATFFRVFFADKGRITSVGLSGDLPAEPAVTHILLEAGDTVEATSREVFLGQLLWQLPLGDRARLLPELLRASEHAIAVEYEPEAPAPR
ncbi:acetyl-CoA carboxylase biotin carboxylase subunit family protein [Streptomyces wuyuanensis]|uniref:ATP-grasp domain-containing protein n=1 Tax=Streptomyces wuyuanensis TaxID=1196353 RepID=UPI00371373F3